MNAVPRFVFLLIAVAAFGACRGPTDSRGGFLGRGEIGLVLDSAGRSLVMFQLEEPTATQTVSLPASPADFAVRGDYAALALGDAGSVALIDLDQEDPDRAADRFAAFPGRVSAVAFTDTATVLAANATSSTVALIRFGAEGAPVQQTAQVPPDPRKILVALGRAYVLSSNNAGEGVITILDAGTLEVLGSVRTGGTNPQDMAWGSADRLYVVNAGNGVSPGSLGIVSPLTPELVETVPGMGISPTRIFVDKRRRAYISSRVFGTVVWNTERGEFFAQASPQTPLCAAPCAGATDAHPSENGTIYQTLAGNRAGQVQVWRLGENDDDRDVYRPDELIAVGAPATAIQIRKF